jgi:hypothetical protein
LRSFVADTDASFTLAAWSHLKGFPCSHRGSRRSVVHIGYVTSARCSSIASWLTQKRLSHWLRHTCKVFLVRIAAHAEASFTLATSHLQGVPRSHRDFCRNVFHTGYVTPARFSLFASWLTQNGLSHWLRLTFKVFLDRIMAYA